MMTMKYLWLSALLAANTALGYQVQPPSPIRSTTTNSRLRSFQAQELKLQLDALHEARIPVVYVDVHRRRDLEALANKLTANVSPVEPVNVHQHLAWTNWRLAFTTDDHILQTWHSQARSIHLEFQENSVVHYVVNLGKRLLPIQHRLTWSAEESSGSIVFSTADSIKDGMEAMHDAAINKLGFLKSCKPGITTVYFDGDVWIEKSQSPTGKVYCNIYLREQATLRN